MIHADDMGISASENAATIEAMQRGMVNSGSVMVPCPGFDEMAKYLSDHKDTDAGIHLTLTSEWALYKWRPLLPSNEVSTIIDKDGFLLSEKAQFNKSADADDVEKECRAQINKAIDAGINLTHIDSHMYSTFSNSEILKKYISLGKEFRLPVLLTHELPLWVNKLNEVVIVDRLYCAEQSDYDKGLSDYYRKVLKSIRPGLSCLLVHVAFNDQEMRRIMPGKAGFGAEWRQADFDFFTSDECRQLLKKNNIQLITWREVRDKLFR